MCISFEKVNKKRFIDFYIYFYSLLVKMEPQKGKSLEVTAESVLEMITEDFFKCHICLNNFSSPTFLDCHHTFCLSCLEDLRKSQGRSCNELDCPDCRVKTSLMGRGTSALKRNFTMASLVDAVTNQKKQLRIQQGTIVCSLCNNEAHAVLRCNDCDERLCQDCYLERESEHPNHQIEIIDPILTEKPPSAPKCKKHGEYDYCFYCKTCEALICALCAATSHRDMVHEHLSINDADDLTRQDICLLLSRSEKRVQDYISTKEGIEDQCKIMEAELAHAETKIKEMDAHIWDTDDYMYDEAQEPVKNQTLADFHAFQTARKEEYAKALDDVQANVECLQKVCDSVSEQVGDADKYQLLQRKEELLMRIEDVLDNKIPTPRFPVVVSIKVESDPHMCSRGVDRERNTLFGGWNNGAHWDWVSVRMVHTAVNVNHA
ncbi:E3 ubiquitin-protein ligase TRIM56-like [Patiria miniata]|uniref:Uncharacterized protein n=1 Tax=Patiria miniata TaxID=46514 RepID=A0A913ZJ60_PATMI|nr:E3 ubiquitin-protein ligase TRIM56-like [Patiria miniata]